MSIWPIEIKECGGGYRVFATRDIEEGAQCCEYTTSIFNPSIDPPPIPGVLITSVFAGPMDPVQPGRVGQFIADGASFIVDDDFRDENQLLHLGDDRIDHVIEDYELQSVHMRNVFLLDDMSLVATRFIADGEQIYRNYGHSEWMLLHLAQTDIIVDRLWYVLKSNVFPNLSDNAAKVLEFIGIPPHGAYLSSLGIHTLSPRKQILMLRSMIQ